MSRLAVGVGSVIGGFVGVVAGSSIPPKYLPIDRSDTELVAAVFGALVGAVIGAGPDVPKTTQVGIGSLPPPRFP